VKVSIQDLAKSLGVSPSTVSRALNDMPGVGEEMRAKIRKMAREMGYLPDLAARSLVTGATGNIGLFVPRGLLFMMSNPFFAEVMQGVSDVLDDLGYNYVLSTSPKQYRRLFRTRVVDGIILFALRLGDPYVEELEKGSVPSVIVGSYRSSVKMLSVRPDDYQGVYDAVRYLVSMGHRRIGLLNGPLSSFKSVGCLDGYRRALLESEIDEDHEITLCGEFVPEWGLEGARILLENSDRPSAIVCANDLIASGVYAAAKELGLKIPEDLSVVGFGDFPVAKFMTPTLTTIRTPLREMGTEAGRMLLESVKGGLVEEHSVLFPTSLVPRESVKTISQLD